MQMIKALSTTFEIVLKIKIRILITTSQVTTDERLLVNNWLKLNKLSLNAQQSKYIVFHTPEKKINSFHLIIDRNIIERVS